MVIKLNNLSKWQELEAGKSLFLRGDGSGAQRKIVVHVNTDSPTAFAAIEYGVEYFLAVVDGQETIHFSASGEVEVCATGDGVVWYWTDDGDDHGYEHDPDVKLFVRPMTREQRSPAMDALAAKMEERANRRFALQEANNAALYAQLVKEREDHAAAIAAAQKPVEDDTGAAGVQRDSAGSAASGTGAGAGEGGPGA